MEYHSLLNFYILPQYLLKFYLKHDQCEFLHLHMVVHHAIQKAHFLYFFLAFFHKVCFQIHFLEF